jgi:hypothetical protein
LRCLPLPCGQSPSRKEHPLSRLPLRACVLAAVLLATPASIALAKPSFETGPYAGKVAMKSKPVVEFEATRKRVKELVMDGLPVTCADGIEGALKLPGKGNLKIKRGRFGLSVKESGAGPAYAGTKLTGRLKGRKATGTVRIVYRKPSATAPQGTKCDTGKRKWSAKLDEIVVELPD